MLLATSALKSMFPALASFIGIETLLAETNNHKLESYHNSRLKADASEPCFLSFSDGSSVTISYLPESNEI